MTTDRGFNEATAEAAIELVIDGNCDVRLMGEALDRSDGPAEHDTKELSTDGTYSPESVDRSDFSLSNDTTKTTVTLTSEINWGEINEGAVVDAVIENTNNGHSLHIDVFDDPVTTGEAVFIPEGTDIYELGDTA